MASNSGPRNRPSGDALALDARARSVLWKGGSEATRSPVLRGVGLPQFLERGAGSHVWDVDGNRYVDYLMAWGSALLGHCNPHVEQRVRQQLDKGALFNLGVADEVSLAERLVGHVASADAVRFVASGSEATHAAVRVARAATGRRTIVQCGYHGWLDWCQAAHPAGILPDTLAHTVSLPYNDLDALSRTLAAHPGDVAAVILEPVKSEPPLPGYLAGLRELVHADGALLIFDEVKTGFRFSIGGAQAYFGVAPDISVFGKAIANGYPLAAIMATAAVFASADEVWISGTYHGWPPALAAAHATLDVLETKPVLTHVWRRGAQLIAKFDELRRAAGSSLRLVGLPPMPVLHDESGGSGGEAQLDRFCAGMVARGYFIHPLRPWFIADTHDDEVIEQTLRDAAVVLGETRDFA